MSSLRSSALAGVTWTSAASIVSAGLRLAMLAVVARFLAPRDFGQMSMLLALLALTQAVSDLGASAAVIRQRELSETAVSGLFWLANGTGIALALVMAGAAPVIARGYGEPALTDLVRLVALRFVMLPSSMHCQAILLRELAFRDTALSQAAGAIAGVGIAIGGAVAGWGAYALVLGDLGTVGVQGAAAAWASRRRWRLVLALQWREVRPLLAFGAFQTGERLLNAFAFNVDYLLVGRVLGPAALGFYSMAFELANAPTRFLSPMVTRVALPIFARRKHDDAALGRGFIEMSAMLAWIQYPLLALLGVFGPLVVAVFLGPQWAPVAPALVPLSLFGALRVLANATGPMFLTKGRIELSFAWNVFAAVVGTAVLFMAVPGGILSVARAWVGLMLLYAGLAMLLMRHLIGLRPTAYLRELVKPVLATAAAASAAVATSLLVPHWMSSQLGLLVTSAGVGAVVYMGAAWLLAPSLIVGLLRAARGRQGIPS